MRRQDKNSDSVVWLFAQQRFGIKPGLARVRALLERLDRPDKAFTAVLVGGTNGKGSTAATLATILTHSGKRTGLFTSPHLTHFAERFVVDGTPLAADTVEASLDDLRPHAEALEATFFEIVTVLACSLFARAGVETAVLEVGMGGRFDATNAVTPELSLITNVSLDHTQVLGDTVSAIAADKAGIMRARTPLLTTATGETLDVLQREAQRVAASLHVLAEGVDGAGAATFELTELKWSGIRLELRSALGDLSLRSSLLGRHQAGNVALAALAAQYLGVAAADIRQGTAKTLWPGRLEPFSHRGRRVLLDGAHNPAAARALRDTLADLGVKQLALVVGIGKDKDAAPIVSSLVERAKHVVATRAELSPRAVEPEVLKPLILAGDVHARVEVIKKPQAALERAVSLADAETPVVVAGSLYLVGELRPYLLGETGQRLERWQ